MSPYPDPFFMGRALGSRAWVRPNRIWASPDFFGTPIVEGPLFYTNEIILLAKRNPKNLQGKWRDKIYKSRPRAHYCTSTITHPFAICISPVHNHKANKGTKSKFRTPKNPITVAVSQQACCCSLSISLRFTRLPSTSRLLLFSW